MSFLSGPRILFYTPFFKEWPPVRRRNCMTACRFSRNPGDLARADIVVFHLPNLSPGAALPARRPGQLWAAWSKECEAHSPWMTEPDFRRQFDITMTYRRDSTVWTPYFYDWTPRELRRAPVPKSEAASAVYFQSSRLDLSGRMGYVGELMRWLEVDSYGKALNNRTLGVPDGGRATKLDVIARYRFTLAFENAVAEDYVTEKFFDPLVAGSVPIYLGAPNIADFAPGRNCFIGIRDFDGPRSLAQHLLRLAADEAAYEAHLAWKREPLSPRFLDMVARAGSDPMYRLCAHVRAQSPRSD